METKQPSKNGKTFFLVSEDFCNLAESPDIKIGYRSDHTLHMSIYDNRRGRVFGS